MTRFANQHARRLILLLVALVLLLVWFVGSASGDSVTLRPDAALPPDATHIKLGDLADLEGPYAEALRELVVLPADALAQGGVTLEMSALRDALSRQGVNLGLVSVKGHAVCRLRREGNVVAAEQPDAPNAGRKEANSTVAPVALADGTVAALIDAPVDAEDPATVSGLIRRALVTGLDYPADALQVSFPRGDAALLNQSTLGTKFEVAPIGAPRLGRVNVRVRRVAGWGEPDERVVTAEVAWRTRVVVATRNIARDQHLSADNLALQDVVFDRPPTTELFDLNEARGAVSAEHLRAGEPIKREHLGLPMLVKRGQLVTLTIYRQGFSMTTSAFATADAALGEPVQVRLGQRRRDAPVVTAVVTGPDAVAEGRPAVPETVRRIPDQVADASVQISDPY